MVMAFFSILSLLALGQCLGEWRSAPTIGILAWLTATIGFLALAVCMRPSPEDEDRAGRAIPFAVLCVLGMFAEMQMDAAVSPSRPDVSIWLVLCGLTVLYAAREGVPTLHEARTRILPVVMLGFLIVSVQTIQNDPQPHIDVFMVEQAAAHALVKFENPYTATIPDIYGPASPYYIPLAKNGRTLYGTTYTPLISLLDLPAYMLTGDVRYGHMLALLLSCALIVMMRSSWPALWGGVLLLINPFAQMMVGWSWVEPFVILTFCLMLYFVSRYPRAVPYLFGLFLCTKQTNLALLPLGWMLIGNPPDGKRVAGFFGKALGVFAVINLPFYLWNSDAFILCLITVQLRIPLRTDLISYAAYAARKGWFVLPIWFSFLYLPVGIYLGLRKAPSSAAGFAAASALLLIPFFAISKQGAPNYYFFGLAMLCCVLALTDVTGIPLRSSMPGDSDPLETAATAARRGEGR